MHDLPWAAASALLALVLAAIALDLGSAELDVPWTYSGDALQNQMFVKTMLDHGWFQSNPDLGAPFGQDLGDFAVASGDTLHMALMRVIGFFTGDSAVVVNLFFLLTFALSAAIAYVVLRALALGRVASLLASVLFAVLPYHFLRGEYHLFIASYYAVPLGAWMVLEVLAGRRPSGRRQVVIVAVACVVLGSAHVYYAAFTIILLGLALLVRAMADRDFRAAIPGAAAVALIAVVVLANHAPNIVQRLQDGKNAAIERTIADSDAYGLRVAQVLLPAPGHRLEPLADLRERYVAEGQVQEAAPQAIGAVAAVGLLAALALALMAALRRRDDDLGSRTGIAALLAVLVGTVGGLGVIFALLATPEIRAWGRISIFVGFFGLVAVAWLVDGVERRRGRTVAGVLAAAILVLGFLDQTPAASQPEHEKIQAAYASDAEFVAAIEQRLPAGAAVFELPYEPFPEPQPAFAPPGLGPYDMARGYIHSSRLRWSYGAVKGRHHDWQSELVQLPPELAVPAAAAIGFGGIYVDGSGFADRGRRLVARLERVIGGQPLVSRDGRLAFFDIRARRPAAAAAARAAALEPLGLDFDSGFSALRQDSAHGFRLVGTTGVMTVTNPSARARRATVAMTLVPPAGNADVEVRWPDGERERAGLPEVSRAIDVPARGSATISIRTSGPPELALPDVQRSYYLRVVDPVVVDEAYLEGTTLPRDRSAIAHLSPFEAR